MEIKTLTFNPFQENTYIVYDETHQAAIIDCGCYNKAEQEQLKSVVESNQLMVKYLLNTHLHLDHAFGNKFASKTFGVLPLAHSSDEFLLEKMNEQSYAFGLKPQGGIQPLGGYLTEKDKIVFGNTGFSILHVPGHSAGSLCFYNAKEKVLFSGDVLFRASIGRTDLPGGNFEELIHGITTKLFSLPDDVVVYPGHGPQTTIGYERQFNPFL